MSRLNSTQPIVATELTGVSRDFNRKSLIWAVGQVLCRIWTTLCFELKVFGMENIPKTGGVLLISNHESYLDPVLVAVRLERTMSYFAKSELFKNPIGAWVIRSLNAFPVRQGKGDTSAVKETIRRLQEGHILNIYPEGSRTETGELLPIQAGVALVIKRAAVPVVPVVIDGSFKAWPRTRKVPRCTAIRVLYGPPLAVEGLKGDQIVELIDRTFRKMLADLRSQ